MLGAQVFMFVVSIALAICAWAGLLTPWLLLSFTFLIGCGAAFNAPAWQASAEAPCAGAGTQPQPQPCQPWRQRLLLAHAGVGPCELPCLLGPVRCLQVGAVGAPDLSDAPALDQQAQLA